MENKCNTRTCCCLAGKWTLTSVNTNNIQIRGQFTGDCPTASPVVDETISMPNGFSIQLPFLGQNITVTLSRDSGMITVTNPIFPECGDTAVRSSAVSPVKMNWIPVSLLCMVISFKWL